MGVNIQDQNTEGAGAAPSKTPAQIVADLMAERPTSGRVGGYNPHKVVASTRNPELFQAWCDALPEDLTGADLSPLYAIAGDGDQQRQLREREVAWQPKAPFGDEYNGPIGEDGVPLRRNKTKWETAKEEARLAHINRFKSDYELMQNGDAPHLLCHAAKALMDLALQSDGEGDTDPWDWCQGPTDVVATAAAIRLVLDAMKEIESQAANIAYDAVDRLRRDLKDLSQVTRKYE